MTKFKKNNPISKEQIKLKKGNEVATLCHGIAEILEFENGICMLKLRIDERIMVGKIDGNMNDGQTFRHWTSALIVDDMEIFRSHKRAMKGFNKRMEELQ